MSDESKQALLAQLPAVSEVLARPELADRLGPDPDPHALKTAIREEISTLRAGLLAGTSTRTDVDLERVARRTARLSEPSLIPVVNATGVVMHTNLGRSPLPEHVMQRLVELACGYSNLEYDLEAGGRGHRHVHAAQLVTRVTGAEAALVVNNCAAAVLLCLSAIAHGREVIVSRGELVEIGGAFRVPDVMRQSGAHLVEVGTTNRTRLADYRDALTENTGMLLKVHRSNFAVVGFTEEVTPAELAALGREVGVPTMVDLGSGLVARPAPGAFGGEPEIAEITHAGVDLLSFSGDKLLGGPQAGIIAGRRDLVKRLAVHPLLRALRPDKLTFGVLEGVLAHHAAGDAAAHVPTTRMLAEDADAVAARRAALLGLVDGKLPAGLTATPVDTQSRPGGGSLPLVELPSAGLRLEHPTLSAEQLHLQLRSARPPVIGRIEDDRLLLDLRTVLAPQLAQVAAALIGLTEAPTP